MANKKIKYPKGFSPHFKPTFPYSKPSKIIPAYTELSKTRIYDGEELEVEEGVTYKITLDYDYASCYYPSDIPSIEAYLIKFSEEEMENSNYESELRNYNYLKNKHKKELTEWNKWKVLWDEEQAKNKEASERKLLDELKQKYDK